MPDVIAEFCGCAAISATQGDRHRLMAAAVCVAVRVRHRALRAGHFNPDPEAVLPAGLAVEGNGRRVSSSCQRVAGIA